MSETGPPYYLEARWNQYLRELFDEPDRSAVLEWLKRHSGESRVILVGAGFTRNAETPSCINIPLWKEQSEALRRELGLPDNAEFTDLELPDLYRQQHPAGHARDLSTVLKGLVPNDLLKPGKAHDALWRSLPIAVITTNYLDTTLEKSRPPRYRRVVRDQELAPTWGRDGLCPLIYFHGHRTDPKTWVAGRRDYERIEQTRPILVAKVRQLVAEYPVLIVGYSLSDPDFHSIYRSTTEAMNNHHPGALALMLPADNEQVNERQLAKEYWRQNRLSIVSFRQGLKDDWDTAHQRFFELTLEPSADYQFQDSLEVPNSFSDIHQCLERNIRAAKSALDCEPGDEPEFLAEGSSRRRAWHYVLERSVLPDMRKAAEEKAARANQAEHAQHQQVNGQKVDASLLLPPPPDESKWLFGDAEWKKRARSLVRHMSANSNEIWILEQLVARSNQRKKLRALAWEWIRFGFEKDLHYLVSNERGLLAALGILSDSHDARINAFARLAREHKTLLQALEVEPAKNARGKRKTQRSTRLIQGREYLLSGDRAKAREVYRDLLDEASKRTLETFEDQLQGFFAAQGLLEAREPFLFGEELKEIEATRGAYRSARKVDRWVSRVRELGNSISSQRTKRGTEGFESNRFAWSAAPRELHGELQSAERLGCPPFWLRNNLLAPLLGEIPDARVELELRLRYLVKDTGNWASSAIERGEFEVNRADPFRRHYSLDRNTRRRGQQIVSGHICQIPNPTYAANLDTLRQAHELICVQDLDAAILGSSKARAIDRMDDPRFGLLCAVAHLTEWNRIRDPLMGLLREERRRDYFEIRRLLPSWPWEQWVRCDDFLANGGLDALRILCSTAPERTGSDSTGGSVFASNVGYVLSNLLHLDRENLELIRLAKSWLIQAAKRVESETTLLLPAVTLLGLLQTGGQTAGAFAQFARAHHQSLLQQQGMHFDLLLQAARAPEGSPMQKWGQQELYSWGETHTDKVDRAEARRFHRSWEISSEAAALVFLIERYPELRKKCRRRLFDLMDVSWDVLSTLGSVLEPMYWDDDWERLRSVLALGGRRRDPHTWNLERFALTMAVTFDGLPKVKPLHPECQFLYRAALDAMSHHEERVANSATYAALLSAPFLVDAADQNMAALAIVSAADDVRTSVAHGAAFAAGYWQGLDLASPILREAGEKAWQMLSDDPAAIIHRQYRFGLAKGRFGRGSGAPQAS